MQKGASFFCWGIFFLILMVPRNVLSAPQVQVSVTATVLESITYIVSEKGEDIQTNMPSGYWRLEQDGKRMIIAKF